MMSSVTGDNRIDHFYYVTIIDCDNGVNEMLTSPGRLDISLAVWAGKEHTSYEK